MSVPADAMSGLLAQYGLVSTPQPQGGLMGALNAAMAPYGGPAQAGLAMMANTSGATNPMAAISQGLLNSQQLSLRNDQQRLQNAQLAQQVAMGRFQMGMMGAQAPYIMRLLQDGDAGAAGSQSAPAATSPGAYDASSGPALPPPDTAVPGAAPSSAPQQGNGPDPWALISCGTQMQLIPMLSGYGNALVAQGQAMLANDPRYVTAKALAGSTMSQDQAAMDAATKAQDPQAYISAYTKFLTDTNRLHISSMSGNVTGFGLPPWVLQSMANYNPQSGKMTVNGRQQLIPGAADTEAQLEAARAGAEENARLHAATAPASGGSGAATSPPSAGAPGTPLPPNAGPVGAAAVSTPNYVPPILAQAGNVAPKPGTTGLAALQALQTKQAELAPEVARKLQEDAETGQGLLTQTQLITAAAQQFKPGKYADARGEFLNILNSAGLITPQQVKELGAYQEATKLSIQLQALATKQLGSREAAQVFSTLGKSIPNLSMSANGLEKVTAYLEGVARYNIARSTFAQRLLNQGNAGGTMSVEDTFRARSNPVYYILASSPPDVRAELLASLPQARRTQIVTQWNQAARDGLAPMPNDYQGQ